MSSSRSNASLVSRRLYRSLLKAAKPFTSPSPKAVVYNCFLHHAGGGGEVQPQQQPADALFLSSSSKQGRQRSLQEAQDLSKSYASQHQNGDNNHDDDSDCKKLSSLLNRLDPDESHETTFQRLLREVVSGKLDDDNTTHQHRNNEMDASRRQVTRQMQLPKQVDTTILKRIIQREFRWDVTQTLSHQGKDDKIMMRMIATRQKVAFIALRELNKKLDQIHVLMNEYEKKTKAKEGEVHASTSASTSTTCTPTTMRKNKIRPLPMEDPTKSYLKKGTFLLAHPLLTGYFRQAVICILHHSDDEAKAISFPPPSSSHSSSSSLGSNDKESSKHDDDSDDSDADDDDSNSEDDDSDDSDSEDDDSDSDDDIDSPSTSIGTYGLVVNGNDTGNYLFFQQTLHHVMRVIPEPLEILSSCPAAIGGPVHATIQMVYKWPTSPLGRDAEHDANQHRNHDAILLEDPKQQKRDKDEDGQVNYRNVKNDEDGQIYAGGNLIQIAAKVRNGELNADDICFYVGASTWDVGQLQSEMERGYWIPCQASPEILLRRTLNNKSKKSDYHEDDDEEEDHNKSNMWLDMMHAMGPEEGYLAALLGDQTTHAGRDVAEEITQPIPDQ